MSGNGQSSKHERELTNELNQSQSSLASSKIEIDSLSKQNESLVALFPFLLSADRPDRAAARFAVVSAGGQPAGLVLARR